MNPEAEIGLASPLPFSRFMARCREIVGPERVRATTASDVAHTGARERTVAGVVFPHTTDEVARLVRAAGDESVPVYPVSRGKNWGLGSRLPVEDGAVLLDLSQMCRIREINAEFGYAVVEPGVTQEDLANELNRRDVPFFLDVTGSGRKSSVLGNALERGIAYHSQRAGNTRALEVVTGAGDVLRTGFQDPRASILNNLYDYGIGPDLRGLFYQSGYGIVTALTVDLISRTELGRAVTLNISREVLPDLMEALRDLTREEVIGGIPHIANRERLLSTTAPLIRRRSAGRLDLAASVAAVERAFPEDWSMIASVSGSAPLVRAKLRRVRARLGRLGRLRVTGEPLMGWMRRIPWFLAPNLRGLIEATRELSGLCLGQPTDDALGFLDHGKGAFSASPQDPDDHPVGFLYVLPLSPLSGVSVRDLTRVIDAVGAARCLVPAVTLNVLGGRVLEAVVSVNFDKSRRSEFENALQFSMELLDSLSELGIKPYRLHVDQMKEAFPPNGPWASVLEQLKGIFDPRGIIAPGRYHPRR